jgi:Uma2 family endonuclease
MTTAAVPFEAYQRTSYRPEMEYAYGRLVERRLGDTIHSRTQALVAGELGSREERRYRTFVAPRVWISDEPRIRVPDVCVMALPHEVTPLLRRPHLAIEILSPEDDAAELLTRLSDFEAAGIPHVWIVDPYRRRLFEFCRGRRLRTGPEVLATAVVGAMDFAGVFAEVEDLTTSISRSPHP